MGKEALGFISPPVLAVTEGATTPNPGAAGVVIRSSTANRLLEWTGSVWRGLARIVDFTNGLSSALTSPFTGAASNTTNQAVLTLTIPAGSFPAAGATWRVRAFGLQSQSANANNVSFGVSVNGTTIVSAAVAAGASAQTNRACDFEAEISFPTVGASGTATGGCKTTISATTPVQSTNATPPTVDTTGTVTIVLFCANSTSNAANIIRVQSAEIAPTTAVSGATGVPGATGAPGSGGENPVTYNAGNSSTAITIDCANGPKQTVTLTAATPTITITNLASVSRLRLVVKQDATGGRVPSFVVSGATLRYQAGQAPLWSATGLSRDVASFAYDAVDSIVDVDAGIGYV